MSSIDNISVVIVLYRPTQENLRRVKQIALTCPGIIVDNSPEPNFTAEKVGQMSYLPLFSNKGIATAQNTALRLLLSDSIQEYVVFLDQDSVLSADYVKAIVHEYIVTKQRIENLAIIGPTVINIDTQREYKSVIHHNPTDAYGFKPQRDVISSGSCIELQTLREVGIFDEDLFIDYVDFEWCWRAESKGYVCGITSNVQIQHQVGRKQLSIGGYIVILSSPIRYYYQYRNHLWLCKRKYVPLQWKLATSIKHLLRFFYFPLVVHEGTKCWTNMFRGIKASFHKPMNQGNA